MMNSTIYCLFYIYDGDINIVAIYSISIISNADILKSHHYVVVMEDGGRDGGFERTAGGCYYAFNRSVTLQSVP